MSLSISCHLSSAVAVDLSYYCGYLSQVVSDATGATDSGTITDMLILFLCRCWFVVDAGIDSADVVVGTDLMLMLVLISLLLKLVLILLLLLLILSLFFILLVCCIVTFLYILTVIFFLLCLDILIFSNFDLIGLLFYKEMKTGNYYYFLKKRKHKEK
jgi:hypothetical protein